VGLWRDQTVPCLGCHRQPRPPHVARARQGRAVQRSRHRLQTGDENAHEPLEAPPQRGPCPAGSAAPAASAQSARVAWHGAGRPPRPGHTDGHRRGLDDWACRGA
jgi:hypothetical protein